jgi:exosortase
MTESAISPPIVGLTARLRALPPLVWAQAVLVLALLALLYAGPLSSLAYDWWTDDNSSYGMVVPPMAFYIAWLLKERLFAEPVSADSRGLLLVAAGCCGFLVGRLGAEFFLTQTSIVTVLAGLIWTFWGVRRLAVLAFPLVLLVTMVPLPAIIYNQLAAPLQLFASFAATEALQLAGYSVYRDGNIIYLPGMSLGVAEACSGLRSMMSLVIASLLLGYLMCRKLPARVLLLALSVPIAILVNVLRVTGTAVLGDHNPEYALGFYHSFSGWLVFVAGFGLLWLTAKLVHWGLER